MTKSSVRPVVWTFLRRYLPSLLLLLTLLYAFRVLRTGIANFKFDDALMFVRYARNMRRGIGIAWDPGGRHVFGPTSLPWLWVAWAGSFVRVAPAAMMVAASWLFGFAALGVLSFSLWLTGQRVRSVSPSILGVAISLPLLLNQHFQVSMTNGMETMLALLLMTCFVVSVARLFQRAEPRQVVGLAVLGYLVVLTRPEAVLSVCALPLAAWCVQGWLKNRGSMAVFLVVLMGLLGITVSITTLYFGSALPLAVYCKSLRGYEGYRLLLNPLAYFLYFLEMACVPCLVLALCARRRHLRMLVPFVAALFLQVAYLTSVNQIMGWGGRYYIPYLPLIFVPAILIVNDVLGKTDAAGFQFTGWRLAGIACVVCVVNSQVMASLYEPLARFTIRHRQIYAEPVFVTAGRVPLPAVEWWDSCLDFSEVANALPSGATVSSSEVGVVGLMNPNLKIIDSSGLNDPVVARGFSPEYIFARKPDLIWLIHPDYTKDFGELSADPRLLQQYTLYAHALNFGVAIRKDSPSYGKLTARLQEVWDRTYPEFRMDDYKATAVSWQNEAIIDRKRTIVVQP